VYTEMYICIYIKCNIHICVYMYLCTQRAMEVLYVVGALKGDFKKRIHIYLYVYIQRYYMYICIYMCIHI